jgi:hypothetical protein
MKKVVFIVMVCGLVLLAFSATASAKTKALPFKGYMIGTIAFSPGAPGPLPNLWVTTNAVGDVAHLGASTMWSQHAAANDFGGVMTLTAANGDTVECTYVGVGNIPPDIAIGDWYDVSSVTTIVGGTGRFAAASGSADGVASLQFMGFGAPVWPGIWSWTGTISY